MVQAAPDGSDAQKWLLAQDGDGVRLQNYKSGKFLDVAWGSASDGADQLYSGTTQIKIGSAKLKEGASALEEGTEQLSEGADALKDGILTLKDGVPALVDGVSQLRDGSMQLSDGLKKFNEEGISKITSLLKDSVGNLAERLKATIKVAQNYKSYSGLTDKMDGEVKFIYKTEEIS